MNGRELISEEKGTSSGRGKCFPLDIERGQLSGPQTQSGLFATKTTIEETGIPPVPASRKLEAVMYSAGSRKG